jgi:hypothetical protein
MKSDRSIWNRIKDLFRKPTKKADGVGQQPEFSSTRPETPVAPQSMDIRASSQSDSPALAMVIDSVCDVPEREEQFQELPDQSIRQPPAVALHDKIPALSVKRARQIDLVLGVDLGTSCTKVVIGDPGWQDKFYAVPFKTTNGDISGWLNTTRIDGESNLKMRLMRDPYMEIPQNQLACYLAGVIRHSLAWFEQHAPAAYKNCDLSWSLSLGFPGKNVKGHPLRLPYLAMANLAIDLVSHDQDISMQLAKRLRSREIRPSRIMPPSRVFLYPEIAAQLAGYVNSPYKERGNLLLIDVGAGTLDVSTIIVHDVDSQDVVSFHHCEVVELGAYQLFLRRARELEGVAPGCMRLAIDDFQDGTNSIPDELAEYVHNPSRELEDGFRRASREHERAVIDAPFRCLVEFRNSLRSVHVSPRYDPWGNSLRFFLTGGGSRLPFFNKILANGRLENELVNNNFTRWEHNEARRQRLGQGFRLETIPCPNHLQNFPETVRRDFDRMSVAYGLAYGHENLMKITALQNEPNDSE